MPGSTVYLKDVFRNYYLSTFSLCECAGGLSEPFVPIALLADLARTRRYAES
jgi:hypothetical protein